MNNANGPNTDNGTNMDDERMFRRDMARIRAGIAFAILFSAACWAGIIWLCLK